MIGHVIDHATWRADLDQVLRDERTRSWQAFIVPSEALATTVRNEVWLAWGTEPIVHVWPDAVQTLRREAARG